LNSSKITSSIRLPVSISAVAMMVSEPPSSMFRAAPKNRLGRCSAFASTPPVRTLPEDGTTVLNARPRRVIESSRMTTSRLCSTSLLAFSMTISETATWRVAGSSKVEDIDFALHRPLHVGHFLGPFVDQKDDQVALRVVRCDRMGDVLQQNRLTGPRRRHDQRPLAFADRTDEVDDAGGSIPDRRVLDLHLQTLIGVKRGEVVEGDLVAGAFGILEIDLCDLGPARNNARPRRGRWITPSTVSPVRSENWRIISGLT
jgi:hypothetical protein